VDGRDKPGQDGRGRLRTGNKKEPQVFEITENGIPAFADMTVEEIGNGEVTRVAENDA
jgi:hypothetical protein